MKKSRKTALLIFSSKSAFNVDDLLAIVGSASLANSVRENVLTALRALNHTRHIELPDVRTSLVTSRLRDFLLRYCHFTT